MGLRKLIELNTLIYLHKTHIFSGKRTLKRRHVKLKSVDSVFSDQISPSHLTNPTYSLPAGVEVAAGVVVVAAGAVVVADGLNAVAAVVVVAG